METAGRPYPGELMNALAEVFSARTWSGIRSQLAILLAAA
jgi:hypothetical protein